MEEKKQEYIQKMVAYLLQEGKSSKGIHLSKILPILSISKAYFYRFFPSLEDFWREVLKELLKKFEENLAILSSSSPYQERYKEFLASHLLMLQKIPDSLIQEVFLRYPSLKEEIYSFLNAYEEKTLHFLQEGSQIGFFHPNLNPLLIQRSFTAGIKALLDSHFLTETGESFYSLLSQFLYMLHRGALSSPDSIDIEGVIYELQEREDALYH